MILKRRHHEDEPERYDVQDDKKNPIGQVWFNPKNGKWGVSSYEMPWFNPIKRKYYPSKDSAIDFIVLNFGTASTFSSGITFFSFSSFEKSLTPLFQNIIPIPNLL